MVEDYGADYIKMDFNQDFGVGTDNESNSFGDGLEQVALAFAGWVEEMTKKFPQVIFEGCSSGGMRMDYKTLSLYPLVSTSDQVCCYKYPKIACNILSAVIPEQSAVWAYPVGGINGEMLREVKKEWADENVDEDRVALNMINSFLGRMHLAGHIELLDGNRFELVKEGVRYYEKLALIKKKALPCFPLGFTGFEKKNVCAGIFEGNNYYIAVYNLGGERKTAIPFKGEIKCAKVGYPSSSTAKISKNGNNLEVEFDKDFQAIFVEVSL
jgi:alpha-galactosidase